MALSRRPICAVQAHMVHEVITSILEQQQPYVDASTAANEIAAGICAHESAMNDGAGVLISTFK